MSLAIDTTCEYLRTKLGISAEKLDFYRDKSIDEILQAEAAQGNQAAIQMAADMFSNPKQLVELFQLSDSRNKLIILNTMTTSQIEECIPMLETEDMLEGLKFFTTDKLLDMLEKIPKEELLKTVFEMFSPQRLMELMPEKQLDKMLTSIEMDKGLLLNNLKSIPEIYLVQMLESVTGETAQGNSSQLTEQISNLNTLDFKTAIKNLDPNQKRELSLSIATSDPKYYLSFDSDAYTKIIGKEQQKNDIIKSMGVIKPEHLQKMLQKLPRELLSVVITQIEPEKFAHMLIYKFPQTLAQLIAS